MLKGEDESDNENDEDVPKTSHGRVLKRTVHRKETIWNGSESEMRPKRVQEGLENACLSLVRINFVRAV